MYPAGSCLGIDCLFTGSGLSAAWWPIQACLFPLFLVYIVLYTFFINFGANVENTWNSFWTDVNDAMNYVDEQGPVWVVITLGFIYMAIAFSISVAGTFWTVLWVGLAWAEDEGDHVTNTFKFIWIA